MHLATGGGGYGRQNNYTKTNQLDMTNRMKNMMLAAVLLFAATFVQAQEVQLGLRAGVNLGNVRATEILDVAAPDFNTLASFQASAFADIPVAGSFAFQPELSYNRKGFQFADGMGVDLFGIELPVGVRTNTSFDYLETALLGKVYFGEGNTRFYAVAGPSFGYATVGQVKVSTVGIVELDLSSFNLDLSTIGYEQFEVSGIVGGGVAIPAGTGTVQIDARYQHGFTQLYDIPLVAESLRNQGFILSAGYAIPLGGN